MTYEMHGREKRSGKPILERERKVGLPWSTSDWRVTRQQPETGQKIDE
jgi:hypothetical protein